MKKYVAVAGTIGSGKTSLVKWLAKTYGFEPYYEPNEQNPYLDDFYRDMPRWAFHSQAFFLAHKLDLHQALERSKKPAVIDRTIYEDAEIFAKNLRRQKYIETRDWNVYWRLYEGITKALRPPDVLVAVTCSLAATKKRIAKRNRASEKAIPDAYLRNLHRAYGSWFASYAHSPIVHVDTTKMDYVEDMMDLLELRKTLDKAFR
ncbi:MAG: deoxynucleoside kinase [Polyangiaceae bacterium]